MYEVRDNPALHDFIASLLPEFEDTSKVHPLPTERIDASLGELGLAREDFYDTFALYVARAFLSRRTDFEVAYRAINDMYFWQDFPMRPESFALDVYRAFDAGAYLLPGDPQDVEPSVAYTIPMLRELFARCGAEERSG